MITLWSNFFVAQVAASAALAGLIFVGMALNLTRILSLSVLPNRGGQALMLLIGVVLISSVMLIPDATPLLLINPSQPATVRGVWVLGIGLILWWANTQLDMQARKSSDPRHHRLVTGNMVLNQIATLSYVVAGILLIVLGDITTIALVPAIFISFIKAMSDAWVLLVEINR